VRYALLLMFLVDCTSSAQDTPSPYAMACSWVAVHDARLVRCENSETVCYAKAWTEGGVSCKFKEVPGASTPSQKR
jgi:hypothetical protein